MKIEVGKIYVTRTGVRAFVWDLKGDLYCYVSLDGKDNVCNIHGFRHGNSRIENEADLVSEYIDPQLKKALEIIKGYREMLDNQGERIKALYKGIETIGEKL